MEQKKSFLCGSFKSILRGVAEKEEYISFISFSALFLHTLGNNICKLIVALLRPTCGSGESGTQELTIQQVETAPTSMTSCYVTYSRMAKVCLFFLCVHQILYVLVSSCCHNFFSNCTTKPWLLPEQHE